MFDLIGWEMRISENDEWKVTLRIYSDCAYQKCILYCIYIGKQPGKNLLPAEGLKPTPRLG